MIKNTVKFEITIEGKTYQLFCDAEAQIAHAKEFAFQFLKYLGHVEDTIKAQENAQKVQEQASKEAEESEPKVENVNHE